MLLQGYSGGRPLRNKRRLWKVQLRGLWYTTLPFKTAEAWQTARSTSSAFRACTWTKGALMTLAISEGFFLFCFLFCFSCKNCSKGKWWCNLGVKKKCYEEKHFDISAFLSEEMVLCLRAAAGESWGRIPKATTMTLWELPSWATLTVSPPFCSLTTNSIHYTYYDFFLEFQVTNWARRLYCQSNGCCCLEFPRATYIRSLFCVDTEI